MEATCYLTDGCVSRVFPCADASGGTTATGRLEGTAFVGVHGHQSYTSGTKIFASGPVNSETETNAEGKFACCAPPGNLHNRSQLLRSRGYPAVTVEAQELSRTRTQTSRGQDFRIVTATSGDPKIPSPTETITEKTIRDAPNIKEQFDSLLPLVPGVVRGPDGHINLKGASNTQSGALVNSANVTDPATGGPAINLPIEWCPRCRSYRILTIHNMASSPEPFHPVETKTGSYQGYHFSIQNVLPRWRDRGGHIVGIGAATPRMTFTGPIDQGPHCLHAIL